MVFFLFPAGGTTGMLEISLMYFIIYYGVEGKAPDRFQESYSIQLMNGSMPRVILVYNQVIKSFFNMQK